MGLTAAEAFMLISFILLLLLGLWRQGANEKISKMERFLGDLSPEQREIAIVHKDDLSNLGNLIHRLDGYKKVIDATESPEYLERAISIYKSVKHISPSDIEKRAYLLDRQLVERLAEAAALMPDNQLRMLTDLARMDELPSISSVKDSEQMIGALKEKLTMYQNTGLSPEEIAEIGELRRHAGRTGKDVAIAIRNKAGSTINRLGGKILDNGNVIFPEGVLFDSGSAAIKPQFERVLAQFCRPWFEILYNVDKSLSRVQIEGHASSDWNNLSSDVAFERNLDLSQRRAGAVFKKCLSYGGNDEIAQWARSKLAAIGFSSSRTIKINGVEDRERSRRVVFAIDTRSAQDIVSDGPAQDTLEHSEIEIDNDNNHASETLSNQVPNEDWYDVNGYQKLIGKVNHVRDGDTIVVDGTPIRLEGIHAPELKSKLGLQSKKIMEEISLNRDAVCWLSGERTYDRLVGTCFVQGDDIGGLLIRSGLGRDCPAFSNGRYSDIEDKFLVRSFDLPIYCEYSLQSDNSL